MKTFFVILTLTATVCFFSFKLRQKKEYVILYENSLNSFRQEQTRLLNLIKTTDLSNPAGKEKIRSQIKSSRGKLKAIDFWLRYFEPIAYRKLNGPLPVEWETEVFEKFEAPYQRK